MTVAEVLRNLHQLLEDLDRQNQPAEPPVVLSAVLNDSRTIAELRHALTACPLGQAVAIRKVQS